MSPFALPRVTRGPFYQPRTRARLATREPFAVDWSRVWVAVSVGFVLVMAVAL